MPANLPPQYFEVEKRYREAKTAEEKVAFLEEMLRIMPKHKGTEHLQGDLKRKIAKLKAQPKKKTGASQRGSFYLIDKEGAAQVALVGGPNVGKSTLLKAVTNAEPEIAEYQFTTRRPQPGMMPYDDIQIQLVDTPAVSEVYMEPWLPEVIRHADVVCLLADLSADSLLEDTEGVLDILNSRNVFLKGELDPEDNPHLTKKTAIIANKCDLDSGDNLDMMRELFGQRFPIIPISAERLANLGEFKAGVLELLQIIRCYTKAPGKEADYEDPVILKRGQNVLDMAREIHKDFAEKLTYARIWGKKVYDGQKVQKDHLLCDGDVVEFHI